MFIENVSEERPEILRDLVDGVTDPRIAVCLDVGHANKTSRLPLPEWVAILGSRIGHVHLSNNDGVHDCHWRLDRGTLDVPAVLDALTAAAPDASYTLECAEEEASLAWLAELGYLG